MGRWIRYVIHEKSIQQDHTANLYLYYMVSQIMHDILRFSGVKRSFLLRKEFERYLTDAGGFDNSLLIFHGICRGYTWGDIYRRESSTRLR